MARFRVYTGPTVVQRAATALHQHGVNVLCEGTEHVYVETDKLVDELVKVLKQDVGEGFSYRDFRELK